MEAKKFLTKFRKSVQVATSLGSIFLIEKRESHVLVGLFVAVILFLFRGSHFFLLIGSSRCRTTGRGGYGHTGTGGGSGRAEISEKRANVDSVESLGEKRRPVRFDRDACGFQKSRDFIGGDGNAIIVED